MSKIRFEIKKVEQLRVGDSIRAFSKSYTKIVDIKYRLFHPYRACELHLEGFPTSPLRVPPGWDVQVEIKDER